MTLKKKIRKISFSILHVKQKKNNHEKLKKGSFKFTAAKYKSI
jgi:hypothetical protein